MDTLSSALTVLSAMATPVVLIMACSSLLLSTSQRLNRSIERSRKVSERLNTLKLTDEDPDIKRQEGQFLLLQLNFAIKRAGFLQRAMTMLYLTLSLFVVTIILIGVLELVSLSITWAVILFGMSGAMLLFYSSILLIMETRLALSAVNREVEYMRLHHSIT